MLAWAEILSPISEMAHKESVEGEETENGVYAVKMKLFKPIPQFMPIQEENWESTTMVFEGSVPIAMVTMRSNNTKVGKNLQVNRLV